MFEEKFTKRFDLIIFSGFHINNPQKIVLTHSNIIIRNSTFCPVLINKKKEPVNLTFMKCSFYNQSIFEWMTFEAYRSLENNVQFMSSLRPSSVQIVKCSFENVMFECKIDFSEIIIMGSKLDETSFNSLLEKKILTEVNIVDSVVPTKMPELSTIHLTVNPGSDHNNRYRTINKIDVSCVMKFNFVREMELFYQREFQNFERLSATSFTRQNRFNNEERFGYTSSFIN